MNIDFDIKCTSGGFALDYPTNECLQNLLGGNGGGVTGPTGPSITGPTGTTSVFTLFPATGVGTAIDPITLADGANRSDILYYNGLNWEISRTPSAATITVGIGGQVGTLTAAFAAGCNQVRIISNTTEAALSFGTLVGDVVIYIDVNTALTLQGTVAIPAAITSISIIGVSPDPSSTVNFDTPSNYFTRPIGGSVIRMQLEKIHIINNSAGAATSLARTEDFQIRMRDCRVTANSKSFLVATTSINLEMSDCTMDSAATYLPGIIISLLEAGHVMLRNVSGNDRVVLRFWTIDIFTENVNNFNLVEIADGSHVNLNNESNSSSSVVITHSSSNVSRFKQIVGGGVVGNFSNTGSLTLTRWMFINVSLDLNADPQLIMTDCKHIGLGATPQFFVSNPNDSDTITRCTFENVNILNNSGFFQCNFNACTFGSSSTSYIAPINECIFKSCTFGSTTSGSPFNFFQGGPPWNNTWVNCRFDDCTINMGSVAPNVLYRFTPNTTAPAGPNHINLIWNNTRIFVNGNNATLEMSMTNSQMNNTVITATSVAVVIFTLRLVNTLSATSPTTNIINGITVSGPVTFTTPALDIRIPFVTMSNITWPYSGANINLTATATNCAISNSIIGTPSVGTGNITGVALFEPLVVNTRTRTLTNTVSSNSPTF